MNRRDALQRLFVFSAGAALFPACTSSSNTILNKAGDGIHFDSKQSEFINALANIIIPPERFEVEYPETTTDFITTIINDVYSPSERVKYATGYKAFKEYLNSIFKMPVSDMTEQEVIQIADEIKESEKNSEDAAYFFSHTRRLLIWHFTTSERYLTEIQGYVMAPGFYNGCVDI